MQRLGSPITVLAAGLSVAVLVLILQARRLYFFGDDWAFLLHRHVSWSGLMEPHNEHWSALPVLAFRVMVRLFGIDHYLAFAMMPIALHVVCSVLLYVTLRRHDLPAWPSAIATLMLAFLAGSIGENPLWDFQVGFLGSAVLGLLALILASTESARVPWFVSWVATALSMMSSGMALPMLVWLGLYTWIRRDLVRALLATVPPFAFFFLWYAAYGRDAPSGLSAPSADLVFAFAATGIPHAWGEAVRLTGAGSLVFLALLATAFFAPLTDRARALAMSGLVTCVASYFFLGTSRAALGPDAADAGRYGYFAMLYTLPAFAAGLAFLADRIGEGRVTTTRWAAAALTVILIGNGIAEADAFTTGRMTLTKGLRDQILGATVLIDDHQRFLSDGLSPTYQPDLTVSALSARGVRAELPDDVASPQDVLDASAALQVAASPTSLHLLTATKPGLHDVTGSVKPGGCARLKAGGAAWLDLPPTAVGSQIAITTSLAALPVQLIDGNRVSRPGTVAMTPKVKTFLGSTAASGTLRVTLPVGNYRVCLP